MVKWKTGTLFDFEIKKDDKFQNFSNTFAHLLENE